MKRRKYSEDDRIKLHQLANDLAATSIVTEVLGRHMYHVIEFIFEEYIQPLREENADLRKKLEAKP